MAERINLSAQAELLVELAYAGLVSLRTLCESKLKRSGDWYDTRYATNGIAVFDPVDDVDEINDAVALLDRAGEIERRKGRPHLIRFLEEY